MLAQKNRINKIKSTLIFLCLYKWHYKYIYRCINLRFFLFLFFLFNKHNIYRHPFCNQDITIKRRFEKIIFLLKLSNWKPKSWLYPPSIFARIFAPISHSTVISNIQLTNIFDWAKRVFIMNGKSRARVAAQTAAAIQPADSSLFNSSRSSSVRLNRRFSTRFDALSIKRVQEPMTGSNSRSEITEKVSNGHQDAYRSPVAARRTFNIHRSLPRVYISRGTRCRNIIQLHIKSIFTDAR